MKKDDINWQELVEYLIKNLMLTQFELGEFCGVKQQTVSGWLAGFRHPGPRSRRKLVQTARNNGIDVAKFTDEDSKLALKDQRGSFLDVDAKLNELRTLYLELDVKGRQSLLDFAEFLSKNQ